MRTRLLAAIAAVILPSAALADCVPFETHASIKENQWLVIWQDDEPYAVSKTHTSAKLPLFMHTPAKPQLLHFDQPIAGKPNVATLVYYAGSPGTSVLVPIVEQVVFDLANDGKEILRGTYSEDCERVEWSWGKGMVSVDDPMMGYQEAKLP